MVVVVVVLVVVVVVVVCLYSPASGCNLKIKIIQDRCPLCAPRFYRKGVKKYLGEEAVAL